MASPLPPLPPSLPRRILCSHLSSSSALLLLLVFTVLSLMVTVRCVQEGPALSVSFSCCFFGGDSQGQAGHHDF